MALVVTQNVKKNFTTGDVTVPALRGVSLEIQPGEFTALTGPSGSGKTTLLNLLGGLDVPTEGQILMNGRTYTGMKKNELSDFRLHHIGFVFQAYNLIPVLTALENVEYILMLQNIPSQERRERSAHLFAEMEMEDLLHRFPRELSGGQQQRVAVARALVTNPDIVLADEPTANLDSDSAFRLLDIMAEMQQKRKTTFLFSTHDPRIMGRAKRIIRMTDGQIQEEKKSGGGRKKA